MLAWRLYAASVSLAAGRDLLQSHLARGTRGEQELHSEWALAVTSPAVARAIGLTFAPDTRCADRLAAGPRNRRRVSQFCLGEPEKFLNGSR